MKALGLFASAALLGISSQADAAIFLGLQSSGVNGGAITFVAADNGTGRLSYSGTFDGFTSNIVAQGFPTVPQPNLQTSSINTSSSTAGKLSIYITQTDLNPVGGSLLSSFTSNDFFGTAQSVVLSTYIDRSNGLFGGTQLASRTFTDLGVSQTTSALTDLNGLFSETVRFDVTVGNGFASVNDTVNLRAVSTPGAVPEPATWALMITGFGAVGHSLRRRKTTVSFA